MHNTFAIRVIIILKIPLYDFISDWLANHTFISSHDFLFQRHVWSQVEHL